MHHSRQSVRTGAPHPTKSPRHAGHLGPRVGAGGAGPAAAPPRAGVKRAGGAAAARAGTRPAPSRPRLRARSPPPGHGKEREGRTRRPDAGVSPASRRGTGNLGSRLSPFSPAGSSSPRLPGGQAPPSARGTHVGLPHPDPVGFLTPILQSRTHPLLPRGLESSLSPLPPLPRRGGLAAPGTALFMSPCTPSPPPFPLLVSLSLNPFPPPKCPGGSLGSRPYAKYSGHLARIPGGSAAPPLGPPPTPRPRAPFFPALSSPLAASLWALPSPACSPRPLRVGPLFTSPAPRGFASPSFSVLEFSRLVTPGPWVSFPLLALLSFLKCWGLRFSRSGLPLCSPHPRTPTL